MGINTALGTFSVFVVCREVRHYMCFLLNSLCPKTVEMIANLEQCILFILLI